MSEFAKRSGRRVLAAEFRESFAMALDAIVAHKLRSALTLLGILIGVFSIVIVMTAIRVLQNNIESELSQLGTDTFQVDRMPGVYFGGPEGYMKFFRRKSITFEQCMAVANEATLARSVGLEENFWAGQAVSRYEKSPPNIRLIGASPGVFSARNWEVDLGRPILPADIDSGRYVCVLGSGLAEKLFPYGVQEDDRIKLDGINYRVVGVLKSKGAMFGSDQDNFAVIPITTGLNRYGGRAWRSLALLVQAASQAQYDDTVEQVRGILRRVRKVEPGAEDSFEIFSNDSMISAFKSVTLAVRAGAAAISSIALLAAGIGIMNIMLVSVTERTREIGIRRAVGARKRNILTQFIIEAVVLCEVGGLVGVGLGVAGGNLAAIFLELPPVVPFDWMIIGLLICSAVGIIFGTYPAFKAANLDPIESLRYE